MIKYIFKSIFIKIKDSGRKRRFILYGAINLLITILALQIFILFITPVLATFLSQIVNLLIGFIIYSKRVFKISNIEKQAAIKYLVLSILIWNSNWIGITIINNFINNKNLSAILMVPLTVLISFIGQRFFVFVKYIDKKNIN